MTKMTFQKQLTGGTEKNEAVTGVKLKPLLFFSSCWSKSWQWLFSFLFFAVVPRSIVLFFFNQRHLTLRVSTHQVLYPVLYPCSSPFFPVPPVFCWQKFLCEEDFWCFFSGFFLSSVFFTLEAYGVWDDTTPVFLKTEAISTLRPSHVHAGKL